MLNVKTFPYIIYLKSYVKCNCTVKCESVISVNMGHYYPIHFDIDTDDFLVICQIILSPISSLDDL